MLSAGTQLKTLRAALAECCFRGVMQRPAVPGLGAVSRFFLGSIAEDSDKGIFASTYGRMVMCCDHRSLRFHAGFNGSESPSVSIEDHAGC